MVGLEALDLDTDSPVRPPTSGAFPGLPSVDRNESLDATLGHRRRSLLAGRGHFSAMALGGDATPPGI